MGGEAHLVFSDLAKTQNYRGFDEVFTAQAYKTGRLVETNQMISPLLTVLPWRKGSVFGTTPVALTTKSQPKVFPLVSWTCSGHESPVGRQKRPRIRLITDTVYTSCEPAFLPLSGWTGSSRVMSFSTSHSYSSKTLWGTWSHASREIGPDHWQTWTNSSIFLSKYRKRKRNQKTPVFKLDTQNRKLSK